jgi:hypothetical protein
MDEQMKTALNTRLDDSLRRAQGETARLRHTHSTLVGGTVVSGALSTLLAGVSAVGGAAVIGSGEAGWQITCAVVAALTLIGTLTTGIDQQFRIQESLGAARRCAGELAALRALLDLGTASSEDISRRYASLLAEYASVIG